jgi:hypothetical protein
VPLGGGLVGRPHDSFAQVQPEPLNKAQDALRAAELAQMGPVGELFGALLGQLCAEGLQAAPRLPQGGVLPDDGQGQRRDQQQETEQAGGHGGRSLEPARGA